MNEALRESFASFRKSPVEQFRLAFRRHRVAELQELITAAPMSEEVLNREIWPFESSTTLIGEPVTARALFEEPLTDDRAVELAGALARGEFTLHGNYIWGTGSRVFGPALTGLDDSERNRLVGRASEVLRDDALSSLEKAEAIDALPGFGPNISTGLVMVMDPAGFEIWNGASKDALGRLGYPVSDLEPFEDAAAALRGELGADDFLELDWFLYQLRKGEYGGLPSAQPESARAEGGVTREAVLAAMKEFDELGREAFLEKYGFGRALKYVLLNDGKRYDSKAIYGVAHGIEHPDQGPLLSSDFSGGDHQVARHLKRLGFAVPNVSLDGGHDTGAWIFQANPKYYDIDSAIKQLDEMNWTVEQYKNQIHAGDTAYLWKSGPDGGIVAVCAILTEPLPMPDQEGAEFIRDESKFDGEQTRVRLRIEQVLEPLLSREELKEHEILRDLAPFKFANATNFDVTPQQDAALQALARRETRARVWWVNMGRTFEVQRAGKYLWSPEPAEGSTQRSYWTAIKDITPADTVLHYAKGLIRAVSIVSSAPVPAERPKEMESIRWRDHGYSVDADYRELDPPIALEHIPEDWRLAHGAPFTRTGSVHQGYLYPLKDDLAAKLAERFPELRLDVFRARAGETSKGATLEAVAAQLYIPSTFLKECVELLHRKRQLIFYGPPGTGKTFIARKLARYLTDEDPARLEIVQFHPSYSYEDFVEGYRPALDADGQMVYRLKPGPLVRLAERARASAGVHVLLIDEINRGNLPRIFGELLFLLEYRKERVSLMYSDAEPFELPSNLLVIGTMNTADRSIGLVDAALRRRFHFKAVFPSRPPTDDVLAKWLEDKEPGMREVAVYVDRLNAKLRERFGEHIQVGHSYFMEDGLDQPLLEQIWEADILPFLEEQLFGHEDELVDFELDAIRAQPPAPEPPQRSPEDDDIGPHDTSDGVPDDVSGTGAERA
jgi:MoxR-like ATPase